MNMLRVTLDEHEADFLLQIATTLTGGEELSEREQLILLMGVRFMQHRERTLGGAVDAAVADAIDRHLRHSEN
jgi:hypothetical protein